MNGILPEQSVAMFLTLVRFAARSVVMVGDTELEEAVDGDVEVLWFGEDSEHTEEATALPVDLFVAIK